MLYCNRVSILSYFQDNEPKHIAVTTLTFLGHVTSSVTWAFHRQTSVTF